jgi:hypothetical protein
LPSGLFRDGSRNAARKRVVPRDHNAPGLHRMLEYVVLAAVTHDPTVSGKP